MARCTRNSFTVVPPAGFFLHVMNDPTRDRRMIEIRRRKLARGGTRRKIGKWGGTSRTRRRTRERAARWRCNTTKVSFQLRRPLSEFREAETGGPESIDCNTGFAQCGAVGQEDLQKHVPEVPQENLLTDTAIRCGARPFINLARESATEEETNKLKK